MKLAFETLRVAAALLAAPVVAATLCTGFEWVSNSAWPGIDPGDLSFSWAVTFIVALAHAVVLGLPAYLLLRWRGWTRWWTSLVCGFAIGSVPFAIYFSPFDNAASFSQAGDKVLIENGVTTLAGWIDFAESVGGLGLLGMAGGIAAWLTWYGLGRVFARPRMRAGPATAG
ncbi:MAG TPA: hypothetical protein VN808_04400 [Stellaceae bacterium]|nr:hypothetical protein [Stellaceae bacterium]